jgi:hypothetical protein
VFRKSVFLFVAAARRRGARAPFPRKLQLKTVSQGSGGSAAVKAAPQASAGEWEDF